MDSLLREKLHSILKPDIETDPLIDDEQENLFHYYLHDKTHEVTQRRNLLDLSTKKIIQGRVDYDDFIKPIVDMNELQEFPTY